jgi:hypothetical protein
VEAALGALLPPEGVEPDFSDGLPAVLHEVIARGEQALRQLREDMVSGWIAAGAALKTMQGIAMYRSNSNQPAGRRYAAAYHLLEQPWPNLTKIDRKTRKDAIWLFEQQDTVQAWRATLSQDRRDRWSHPSTLRRHYEQRHPKMLPDKTAPHRQSRRHRRRHLAWNREKLDELNHEALRTLVDDLFHQIDDRDRHITELDELLAEKDNENKRLKEDLNWERTENRQLKSLAAPPAGPVTVMRPDGETVEIVHATSRENREIMPPESYGHPDYAAWARLMAEKIAELSAPELTWLLADNRAHIAACETAYPGAGRGLEDRIRTRIAELDGLDAAP